MDKTEIKETGKVIGIMLTRQDLEQREQKILAPYACFSHNTLGRRFPEDEHPIRTAFQRDKDRIIHCTAFRRLEYKTQVFVNHEGDHFRTRLTHSIEVSQIARTLARALGLNEDLSEAIALAHDLGHTPYGHAGEEALNLLMTSDGGFEHKAQGLRVVEYLEERYADFPGLNLTAEVREGILKSARPYAGQEAPIPQGWHHSLETQAVDMADEIAYNAHDVDDGIDRGYLHLEDLNQVTLWREHAWPAAAHPATSLLKIRVRAAVRAMIDLQVSDLITESLRRIREQNFNSHDDIRMRGEGIIAFSPSMAQMNQEIKRFLMDHLYRHYMVARMTEKAKRMMSDLFKVYSQDPGQLPPRYAALAEKDGVKRVACDYLAGMTDRFASECYKDHFIPYMQL